MREGQLCVLHVAAVGDREALETLCHTTQVIAALGIAQVLVLLDQGGGADLTGSAALAAEVRPLRCSRFSIVANIEALQREFAKLSLERKLCAVHLHGAVPCLLGSRALKGTSLRGRVLYSPHLTHAASQWAAALLGPLMHSYLARFDCVALTASHAEARTVSKLLNRSAEMLPPQPVSSVFFEAARQEGTRPSVLADGSVAQAVEVVTRLCVLLNGRDERIPFSWLGRAAARARAQLEAAGVKVLDVQGDAETAQSLSRASAFVHISTDSGLPIAVAQAMAAGVPCLVSDTPTHRALIRHGETGFICTGGRDFIEKLILLLRDRAERQSMGEAARAEASRCFTLRQFEKTILRAYGFSRTKALHLSIAVPPPSAMPNVESGFSVVEESTTDTERTACKRLAN